jgi:mono/diheme cytochrome c family protein
MERSHKQNGAGILIGVLAFAVLSLLAIGHDFWSPQASATAAPVKTAAVAAEPKQAAPAPAAAETDKAATETPATGTTEPTKVAADDKAADDKGSGEAAAPAEGATCCKAGEQMPPLEVVAKYPPGTLHSPYQDYKKLAEDKELVKQFRLPGCNECHGGTGGGGFCPALTQGVWFWGNTDDVLFRLVSLGSTALEAQGFKRIQWGSVHGPMPPMGHTIKTADHLWKIIAFIRSINPPNSNPPEKVVEPRWSAPANAAPAGGEKPAEKK